MSRQNGANYDALKAAQEAFVQPVELSGFGDGQPWTVKLRRVSLLDMARTGTIPNPLMAAVTELYTTGMIQPTKDDEKNLQRAAEIMHLIAESALVEPSMQALESAGVTLTDTQLTEIFIWVQRGAEVFRMFRKASSLFQSVQDSPAASGAAEQPAGD